MAIYHTQRLFSKKSKKVAGHAVGAAVQGAVSGALLRDALKTKSNLAGVGAVLAGTAAALHTAEAIKAARKKGKEFSEGDKINTKDLVEGIKKVSKTGKRTGGPKKIGKVLKEIEKEGRPSNK